MAERKAEEELAAAEKALRERRWRAAGHIQRFWQGYKIRKVRWNEKKNIFASIRIEKLFFSRVSKPKRRKKPRAARKEANERFFLRIRTIFFIKQKNFLFRKNKFFFQNFKVRFASNFVRRDFVEKKSLSVGSFRSSSLVHSIAEKEKNIGKDFGFVARRKFSLRPASKPFSGNERGSTNKISLFVCGKNEISPKPTVRNDFSLCNSVKRRSKSIDRRSKIFSVRLFFVLKEKNQKKVFIVLRPKFVVKTLTRRRNVVVDRRQTSERRFSTRLFDFLRGRTFEEILTPRTITFHDVERVFQTNFVRSFTPRNVGNLVDRDLSTKTWISNDFAVRRSFVGRCVASNRRIVVFSALFNRSRIEANFLRQTRSTVGTYRRFHLIFLFSKQTNSSDNNSLLLTNLGLGLNQRRKRTLSTILTDR